MGGDVAKSTHQKRADTLVADAEKAFADHQVREAVSDRHWVLQRRHSDGGWDGNMGCDIVVTTWRQIVVTGDIGPMVFAYGSRSPLGTIGWMGGCTDIGYYVAQKARIGMGGAQEEYDSDVAREDLDDLVASFKEYDDDHDEEVAKFAALIDEAKEWHLDDGPDRLVSFLYDNSGDFHSFLFDDGLSVGMVTSPRLIYCHAAVRRLWQLIKPAPTPEVTP